MWNHNLDKAWSFLTGFVRGRGGWLVVQVIVTLVTLAHIQGSLYYQTPNFMHFFSGGNPSSLPYPQSSWVPCKSWPLNPWGYVRRIGPPGSGRTDTWWSDHPYWIRHEVPPFRRSPTTLIEGLTITMVMDTPDIPSIRCTTQHTGTCRCFCPTLIPSRAPTFPSQSKVSWIEGPSWGLIDSHKTTDWWLQSIWKIWVKTGIFPK